MARLIKNNGLAVFADPLSEYFSLKIPLHSNIAVWSTASVKKPDPHPHISASAINDPLSRVQTGKGLRISHLMPHAPFHTHIQMVMWATCTGEIEKSHSIRRLSHTQQHTHLPVTCKVL